MTTPKRAANSPFAIDVTAGKKYFWCACGESKAQPFCDGSHKGAGITPVMYQASKTETLYFCGCKATGKPPFCDGSHNKS